MKKEKDWRSTLPESVREDPGSLRADIVDEVFGRRHYSNVKAVRIHSAEYVLLIMKDYAPTLGRVEGTVVVLTDEGEKKFADVTGFYMHQNNEFTLLITHDKAKPELK